MKPLNFALIGAGRFGKHYVRLLKNNKKARLAAVCTKTKESLNKILSSLPKYTIATTGLERVFADKKIDCAIIATPLSTHYKIAMKAINAGKHVLLEKPMAQSNSEAKKLSAAIKKSGKTFMVGHQYVYNDNINHVKQLMKKKLFGKILSVKADHLYNWQRKDIGCFWDAGTHHLAVIQYLFNPGKISEISGSAKSVSGNFFDDTAEVSLKFENGLKANLFISSASQQKSRKFIFAGEKITAAFDDSKKSALEIVRGSSHAKKIKISAKEPLKNELEHFMSCIHENKTPKTGIAESAIVTGWLVQISKKLKIRTKSKK